MAPRLPSAWMIAAVASAAGAVFGSGTAAVSTMLHPMRIGDFAATATAASGGPRATVPSAEHNFGSMGSGRSGKHRFTVTNEGTSPLTLKKGVSSCRCTVADLEREEIAAGDSADVVVEWKTKSDAGPYRQTVSVATNDPRRPEIALSVFGTVVPTWRAIPPAAIFPRLSFQGKERFGLKLLTYGSPPPVLDKISIAEADEPGLFSCEARPLDAGELAEENDPHATGGYAVEIVAPAGLPIGSVRRTLRAELVPQSGATADDGEEGRIAVEIPIEGTVTGDLAVAGKAWDSTHQSVILGQVSSRSGLRTEVFLTMKGPHRESVAPKVVEVVPEMLQVHVGESKPVGSGSVRRVPIEISIPPGAATCNHLGSQQAPAGRIVLETGHPDCPRFILPVRVSIGP